MNVVELYCGYRTGILPFEHEYKPIRGGCCGKCRQEVRWRCPDCSDYYLCNDCYATTLHEHQMKRVQPELADQHLESIRLRMRTLEHATECQGCDRFSCLKMKDVIQHVQLCPSRKKEEHCDRCVSYKVFCYHHARNCRDPHCKILNCVAIRRQITQDMELSLAQAQSLLEAPSLLSENLSDLFEFQTYADCELLVADTDDSPKTIRAHKAILSTRSPVFRAMFSHGMVEATSSRVHIDGLPLTVVLEMIRFMYTGKVNSTTLLGVELLAASDIYQIYELKKLCEHQLILSLNDWNVDEMLQIGGLYSASLLREARLRRRKITERIGLNGMILKDSRVVRKSPFPVSSEELPYDMEQLFEDQSFADLEVAVVDGVNRTVSIKKVHRAILFVRCPVFYRQIAADEGLSRLTVTDIQPEILVEIVRFLYTDTVPNSIPLAKRLYTMADKFELQNLKAKCLETMAELVTLDNVTEVLSFANLHGVSPLSDYALAFIELNASKVTKTESWQQLARAQPRLHALALRKIASKWTRLVV